MDKMAAVAVTKNGKMRSVYSLMVSAARAKERAAFKAAVEAQRQAKVRRRAEALQQLQASDGAAGRAAYDRAYAILRVKAQKEAEKEAEKAERAAEHAATRRLDLPALHAFRAKRAEDVVIHPPFQHRPARSTWFTAAPPSRAGWIPVEYDTADYGE